MSTAIDSRAVAADAPPPEDNPTTTHYEEVAAGFIKQLNEMTDNIPRLERSHELSASYVRRRQDVPDEFLKTTVSAVEQSEELQVVRKLDTANGRDTLQFIDAFQPVLDRVAAFLKDLQHTVRVRRALLRNDALQIYAVGKALARGTDSAVVASHVDNMARDLGKGKAQKRKPAQPPAPSAGGATSP